KDESVAVQLGRGGSITPPGITNASPGATQAYSITPQAGYYTSDLQIDGVSQGALSSYTFFNVAASHWIAALLRPSPAHIVVEQPAGTPIAAGATQSLGYVATGSSTSTTFTIRNTGGKDLTGLGITIDGADASMFSVTASPTAPVVGPTGATTFTL